jgi:hypothetical protein
MKRPNAIVKRLIKRLRNYEFYPVRGSKKFYFQKLDNGLNTKYWVEFPYLFCITFSLENKV